MNGGGRRGSARALALRGSWRSSSSGLWIERRVRASERLDLRSCFQPTVGPGHGRDDDLGADVARADIDVRADGHAARAAGSAPTKPVDAATAGRLQAVVDGAVDHGAPDMIAAVITADGTWAGAAGIDGPKGRKAESTDEFGIASVSKVLLAALVLKLADQGRIELDAPIERYLEGVNIDANDATVRQALAMRSGIGGTPNGVINKALAECDRPWSTEDVLGTVPAPFTAAGTRYEYSNPTYKLVGVAAEQASGKKLGDALRTLVLDESDSARILLQGPDASPPKPWALPLEGHTSSIDLARFGTGGNLPCVGFATLAWGASGVASDAPTLARWGWDLFAGDVISADRLQEMTTTDTDGHGLGIDRLDDFFPMSPMAMPAARPGTPRCSRSSPNAMPSSSCSSTTRPRTRSPARASSSTRWTGSDPTAAAAGSSEGSCAT